METKKLYDRKYFQASKKFQKGKSRLEELQKSVLSYSPRKVLDVGCGIGFLVRSLRRQGLEAYGVDFSEDLPGTFWGPEEDFFIVLNAKNIPFGDKEFDVVVSSDFFEHLPDGDIDQVLSEMKRVGKKVLARVSYRVPLTPKQSMYHISNQTKEWWEKRLPEVTLI